jgi:hypothetical protein
LKQLPGAHRSQRRSILTGHAPGGCAEAKWNKSSTGRGNIAAHD